MWSTVVMPEFFCSLYFDILNRHFAGFTHEDQFTSQLLSRLYTMMSSVALESFLKSERKIPLDDVSRVNKLRLEPPEP